MKREQEISTAARAAASQKFQPGAAHNREPQTSGNNIEEVTGLLQQIMAVAGREMASEEALDACGRYAARALSIIRSGKDSTMALEGVQLYVNDFFDVLAWRWKQGAPGRAEVVRANRRNFRQNPVRWTIGGVETLDARKLDLKSMRQVTVEALRADQKFPDLDELIRGLEGRFQRK